MRRMLKLKTYREFFTLLSMNGITSSVPAPIFASKPAPNGLTWEGRTMTARYEGRLRLEKPGVDVVAAWMTTARTEFPRSSKHT